MARQEIHVERLLGKRVLALNGRSIGRLEEIRTHSVKDQCYVTEFLVGSYAMFERLSAVGVGRAVLKLFKWDKDSQGYRVPWEQLDLSNPDQPRLRCKVTELTKLKG